MLFRMLNMLSTEQKSNSFLLAIAFKNWHFVLSEDFTVSPKRFADAPLIFVLIKTMHLVGVINGELGYVLHFLS